MSLIFLNFKQTKLKMRAILFCCSLVMFSCTVALAQRNQAGAIAQTPDAKTMFLSNINKFDALASRGNSQMCDKVYNELVNSMEMQVADSKAKAKDLSGEQRKAMNDKIADEIRIIRDAAMMGREDKIKNRAEIKAKMESFVPYF
jgi:hypothetical protein